MLGTARAQAVQEACLSDSTRIRKSFDCRATVSMSFMFLPAAASRESRRMLAKRQHASKLSQAQFEAASPRAVRRHSSHLFSIRAGPCPQVLFPLLRCLFCNLQPGWVPCFPSLGRDLEAYLANFRRSASRAFDERPAPLLQLQHLGSQWHRGPDMLCSEGKSSALPVGTKACSAVSQTTAPICRAGRSLSASAAGCQNLASRCPLRSPLRKWKPPPVLCGTWPGSTGLLLRNLN